MNRTLLAILMFLSALFLPVWLVVVLAGLYAWRFFALELIFIAALVDAYFGLAVSWPYYTIGAFTIIVMAEYAKRTLLWS